MILRVRRLLLALGISAAAATLFAAPALAVPRPVGYAEQITTDHFQVHYKGDGVDHIVHQQAADLAALAEQAYATEIGWGYPAPPDDGDGHIDVWVITQAMGVLGTAWPDNQFSLTTTGWFEVDPAHVTDEHVVAHELFHLIQFGIWLPSDGWLKESSAEWAGFRADGYSIANGLQLAPPDMSVDCVQWNTACAADDDYELGGYSRWSFWEYLSGRFGPTIVKDVLENQAAIGDPSGKASTSLANVLVVKGTTLGDVFQDYAVANLTGAYPFPALANLPPAVWPPAPGGSPGGQITFAGLKTSSLPVQRVPVNHLAARYLSFGRGDGASDGKCFAATLALTVSMPIGLGARPYFYWSANGSTAVPFNVSGNVATISLPWDTCAWAPNPPYTSLGYVSLPNPSATADAQVFTVSGSLTVDPKTIVAASGPPPSTVKGTVVDAPTSDTAPSIFLYGPEVIPVGKDRALRLVVFSSGAGRLSASVGGVDLGAGGLRAGNNDLRFTLPQAAFAALRASAVHRASAGVLTVTSLSPSGAAGTIVTRKLRVAAAPRRRR